MHLHALPGFVPSRRRCCFAAIRWSSFVQAVLLLSQCIDQPCWRSVGNRCPRATGIAVSSAEPIFPNTARDGARPEGRLNRRHRSQWSAIQRATDPERVVTGFSTYDDPCRIPGLVTRTPTSRRQETLRPVVPGLRRTRLSATRWIWAQAGEILAPTAIEQAVM